MYTTQYILLLQANTFHIVIAADCEVRFVFFVYAVIEWGDDTNIGFNATGWSFMVPGALTIQAMNIVEGSNIGMRGLYVYQVENSVFGPNNDYNESY